MANILIIDDDTMIAETISNLVRRLGHQTICRSTLRQGLEAADSQAVDLVFLDVRLPDGDGLEMLPRIQAVPSSPEVVILTGFGDPEGAELAIRHGAWDYLQKPFTVEGMTLSVMRALQYRQEKQAQKNRMLLKREGIVGDSPRIRTCLELLAKVANSDATVFIGGETGTGKELFAVAIHRNSPRADQNFVVVDCAALPENLVESTLFGHEKGAFTGADKAQEGLILQADGGTLFLDEVGELPASIQKNFLRVLQEKKFRPVGGKEEIKSNFRLIAASNRDLEEMVRQRLFREDLLFRLRTFPIELPALRERREDIKPLAQYYLTQLCERYGIGPKEVSPEFSALLFGYPWPGNIRELINALEKTLISARYEQVLYPQHLPTHIRVHAARSSIQRKEAIEAEGSHPPPAFPTIQELRERTVEATEKKYLQDLLAFTGHDLPEACRISGLARSQLYALLKKFKISKS